MYKLDAYQHMVDQRGVRGCRPYPVVIFYDHYYFGENFVSRNLVKFINYFSLFIRPCFIILIYDNSSNAD